MYNPGEDDNELDRLSREAATGYKAPGKPNWDAMQEQLDKIMPEEKKKRRFLIFWWLAPALVLGGFAYYQLKDAPLTAAATIKHTQTTTPVKPAVASTIDPSINSASLPLNKVSSPEVNHIDLPAPATHSLAITKQSTFSPAALPANTPALSNTDANNNPETNTVNLTKPADQSIAAVKPDETKDNVSTPIIADKEKDSIIEPAATESPVITTPKKSKTNKAWSIGMVGSIDESTVKFKYGYEPGYGLGVLAGFHFNKIFSLHSGAIYTQKNYKMAGSDFNAPKGTWASYYKLETVEGYCRMWEVPLLARFYTSHSDKKEYS